MQYRRWGFLIVICLLLSFAVWGQSIQPAQIQPAQDSPAQNSPRQNAPAQNIPIQSDSSMIGASTNGGDFSVITHPKPEEMVPKDTIIVKGAWSSASDSTTPLPEATALTNNVFTDEYFGITYSVPSGWLQKFTPPPLRKPALRASGANREWQLTVWPERQHKRRNQGSIMFTAQDMFFTPLPVANERQFVNYPGTICRNITVELKPTQTTVGGRNLHVLCLLVTWMRSCTGTCWPLRFAAIRWKSS